jgi:hypothetical protein
LPDGIFANQKSQFGYIFYGLGMEDVGIFLVISNVLCTAIWNIVWPFCIFCGHRVKFFCFGMLYLEKSGNPGKMKKIPRFFWRTLCIHTKMNVTIMIQFYAFKTVKFHFSKQVLGPKLIVLRKLRPTLIHQIGSR